MVAVATMILLQAKRDNFLPAAFIEAFEQKLNAKDYQGAYETARADDSFLARVLAAGLGRLNRGYEEAVEGMQEVGEDESMAIDHKLSYIALVASVSPMLGLLGTVQGMIASFQVIAQSTTQPAPKDLASGIATALFTTLEGLIVAIPALIVYGLLKNRIARLILEVGMVSEGLMARFAGMGKSKAGGAAPAAAPAAKAE
jgi:biopolymer transport protein ExbB